jgi:hypothetical protein
MPKPAPVPIKTRKAPNFTGVPGEIVSAEEIRHLNLNFETRKPSKHSPYDDLIRKLVDAGEGKFLLFKETRAHVAVRMRAKKLGFVLAFAEAAGHLYVKYVGRIDQQKFSQRKDNCYFLLKKYGPSTPARVAAKLREDLSDDLADAAAADLMLLELVREGRAIKPDGGKNIFAANPAWKEKT